MFYKVIFLGLAGAAGALARYGLGGAIQRMGSGTFPWGTFAINILGCFLFGFIWTLSEERFLISSQTRIILLVGFMGAFTTFSTFAFETVQMLRDSQWLLAVGNIAAQNLIGLLLLVAGIKIGRMI